MEEDQQVLRKVPLENLSDDGSARQFDSVRQDVQHTFQHFVVQLHLGCGNDDCKEVTCHTGRMNTAKRPNRRYNLRTAHFMALQMCSRSDRTKHLCPYLPKDSSKAKIAHRDTPRDSSSLPQLLSDTRSIKDLLQSAPPVSVDAQLAQLHESLSRVLKVAGRLPRLNGEGYLSNSQIVDELSPCFQWLLKQVPVQRLGPWKMVNRDIISKGYAYPPKRENVPADSMFNTWLVILDGLEHEPSLRLLERAVLAIGQRRALECSLSRADNDDGHRIADFRKSVEFQLAKQLWSQNTLADVFAIVVWLKKLFTKQWDSQPIVRHSTACFGLLQTLRAILACKPSCLAEWPEDTFHMPMVWSRLDTLDSASSFIESFSHEDEEHIFHWNLLFSQRHRSMAFRAVNYMTMSEANSEVEKAAALRRKLDMYQYIPEEDLPLQARYAEKHYLLLTTSRVHVLRETFDQLWQRRKDELRRPLRVRLGETDQLEIGHDLGGVQIEYFNLVCKEAFAEGAGMFTTNSITGCSYFRPGSLQPLHMFELFGMLIALALYNGITLPVCLPQVFYSFLLQRPETVGREGLGLDNIQDAFPVVTKSLQALLTDDVPGLEYSYPLEANGLRLTVAQVAKRPWQKSGHRMTVTDATSTELESGGKYEIDFVKIRHAWPGWDIFKARPDQDPGEVNTENKATYVSSYATFLAYGSVAPQVDALLKGFHAADLFQDRQALALFSPEQLKAHLEGTHHINMNELKECAKYDGYEAKSKYMQNFWRIVSAWPETKQRQLLKFVTAAERIPITGAKHLTFIIKKAMPESAESLPTSSTCFGTLMLPRYPTASVLDSKLSLALKYGSEGFGTG